jgi:uncharacterized protein (DUF952 family)
MDLCHVLTEAAWAAARDAGEVALPDGAAFLHCCTAEQLDFVLGRHFSGVSGLVVLIFAADAAPAELRWEHSEPDQAPFPHLYGTIPWGAVRRSTRL